MRTIRTSFRGFSLIEMMVVISIIGVLATIGIVAVNGVRAKARDLKRVANAGTIAKGLYGYRNDAGAFPPGTDVVLGAPGATVLCDTGWSGSPCTGKTYLEPVPAAPSPDDGDCTAAQNAYTYSQASGGASFIITACLGANVGNYDAGVRTVDPNGVR